MLQENKIQQEKCHLFRRKITKEELSEIAEIRNISKSSVGKTLTTAEEKLKEYEKLLKSGKYKNFI